MKGLLVLLLFSVSGFHLLAQPKAQTAEEIMTEAKSVAAKEGKKVFIIFHASWCVWCHKMDTSMNDPSCKKFFDDNFVVRHLVVDESKDKKHLENAGADLLKEKYNGGGQGIPFWLIFDAQGNLLTDSKSRKEGEGPAEGYNTGCPATETEVAYFISVLSKYTNLNKDQLEVIRKRFRKNE